MSDIIQLVNELSTKVNDLKFTAPVTHTYNPLLYASETVNLYLKKYGNSPKKVLFLGMNPGPFGMAQTGVPFGEISAVKDWLKISGHVNKPKDEHPDRAILGFDCQRSEVSGQRIWKLFKDNFGTADNFFENHFVWIIGSS